MHHAHTTTAYRKLPISGLKGKGKIETALATTPQDSSVILAVFYIHNDWKWCIYSFFAKKKIIFEKIWDHYVNYNKYGTANSDGNTNFAASSLSVRPNSPRSYVLLHYCSI